MSDQPVVDTPYTLRHIEEMLGLSRSVVTGLVNAGFVTPARGPRNELRFSFQDVVLLRTAFHLRAANIPPKRLLSSLKSLRERLPAELPLSGLRIKAVGNQVAVKEGDAQWGAETGQLLMDFEVTPATGQQGSVTVLSREASREPAAAKAATTRPEPSANDWYRQAEQLEGADDGAAEKAYRQALALAPDHVYAAVNLGAMLCEAGRCKEAVEVLEKAIRQRPDEPLLHFNAAIALEDLHRRREALARYEACLKLAPDFVDAHHNAAKLYEQVGDRQGALRHYSAYRRLQLAANSET
ncbi:MAG TPA: tetratricopeptide repeat protein [Ideonella sp.]|uniref:tetratricopeptide repeat protein n=1 Tax=Ideonella sp. TaxID=1929293 RepID=UPI002E3070B0|nr:tetratricopeptide repeat protein [Ideonella sp.]HEX5683703.1 tetratricopeptide repeat protein [Ideonella sp.]